MRLNLYREKATTNSLIRQCLFILSFTIQLLLLSSVSAILNAEENTNSQAKKTIEQERQQKTSGGQFVTQQPYQIIPAHPPLFNTAESFPDYKKLLADISKQSAVNTIAISPDGKILASASGDNTVKLWNLQDRSLLHTLKGHKNEVNSVAFSLDSNTLASASDDNTVKLWNLQDRSLLHTLKGHESIVLSVAFSPDGNTLASASGDKTIKLWNLQDRALLYTLKGHERAVNAVAFSPDGNTLASASDDNTLVTASDSDNVSSDFYGDSIKLWNLQDRSLLHTLKGHENSVRSVAFSPDGNTLASASADGTVKLWNLQNRSLLHTLKGHEFISRSVAFSPDGKILASASGDNTIKLWNLHNRSLLHTLKGHKDRIRSLAFSPDGSTLASGSSDNTVELWNLQDRSLLHTLKSHKLIVLSVAFSPDGNTLATASDDSTVKLWSLQNNSLLHTLKGHDFIVLSVAFSPDGKIFASSSFDNTIKLWNLQDNLLLHTLKGHDFIVRSVAFSPDGKILASASGDNTIKLWNLQDRSLLQTLKGHEREVNSVVFSPDANTLASASGDNTVKLWNLQDRSLLHSLKGHQDSVLSVAFSPDGKTLASASDDKTVKLWNLQDHSLLHTLTGHQSSVNSVTFNPDGNTLASASDDNTVKLWNLQDRSLLHTLTGHQNRVYSVAFSPDGNTLASASYDGTTHLWNSITGKEKNILLAGHSGNWISCQQEKCLRGDNGSFLRANKSKNKNWLSWQATAHPKTALSDNALQIEIPTSLNLKLGESKAIAIKVHNNSQKETAFWLRLKPSEHKIIQLASPKNEISFPAQDWKPEVIARLDAGETQTLYAKIHASGSLFLDKDNIVKSGAYELPLQVISSNGIVSNKENLKIDLQQPDLEWKLAALDKNQQQEVLQVSFSNKGNAPLPSSKISLFDGGKPIADIEAQNLKNLASTLEHSLAFVLPKDFKLNKETLALSVVTDSYPRYSWQLPITSIKGMAVWMYWLLLPLLLFSLIALFYLKRYRHPLVMRLSEHPEQLLSLPIDQLAEAKTRLIQTKRYSSLLKTTEVSQRNFDRAVDFINNPSATTLADQLGGELNVLEAGYYELKLADTFPLNLHKLRIYFPANDLEPQDALAALKNKSQAQLRVTLIIGKNSEYQRQLYNVTKDITNKWIAPQGTELTRLLLAANPENTLAEIVAGQLSLQQISPYRIGGGVAKESVFFGRQDLIAHIINRDPANYLLVGGRQVGKSSLLKAIERRYADNKQFVCLYQVLANEVVIPRLAAQLGMKNIIDADDFANQLQQKLHNDQRHYLFLIDEADMFIAHERGQDYPILHLFRRLSEESDCSFILAGFWQLYQHAVLDYQSPLKNFAEILQIAELERSACVELATLPMQSMNLSYASDAIIDTLIQSTGQRANLIAIACQHILINLTPEQRVIEAGDVHRALNSEDIRKALVGWGSLGANDEERRLNRIIVYLTIEQDNFSSGDILIQLGGIGVEVNTDLLERSLEQLELGFILGRNKNRYFYPVPLFRAMIIDDEPALKLENEIPTIT